METRSSYVLVGAVVIALTIALFAFILWLARYSGSSQQNEYDVFFSSVSGLAQGATVNFQGVPVGQVRSINLMPNTPERVRVRIAVQAATPILQGTRATLSSVGFTGVSIVSLEGAMSGGEPLTERGPFGVPVIPTKPGAIEGLLESAPQLLSNASEFLANLNDTLNAENQRQVKELLQNLNSTTTAFEARAPEIAATLAETRILVRDASDASKRIGRLADVSADVVEEQGVGLAADVRATTRTADQALKQVGDAAGAAQPGLEAFSTQTIPEANALLRDLRATSGSLGAVAGKLDEDPVGALVGGRKLPDYVPEEVN